MEFESEILPVGNPDSGKKQRALEDPQLTENHAHSLLPTPDALAENPSATGYQKCEEVWDMAGARQR